MRFIHLSSIAWLACALLAVAAPAGAWDKEQCLRTDGPQQFRDEMARILSDAILGKTLSKTQLKYLSQWKADGFIE
jgi:hypothetical protein